MHRIPLEIPSPSNLWDRTLPEYVLFDRTLNIENVQQTIAYLNVMDEVALEYNKTTNYYQDIVRARRLLALETNENLIEALTILRKVILRCPKQSPSLATALYLRGNQNLHMCLFEGAANDFEMFLFLTHWHGNYEELFHVHGGLVICYYLMKKFNKIRVHLDNYNNAKAYLTRKILLRPEFEKLERHINQFEHELYSLEECTPEFLDQVYFNIPYGGFNKNDDIPLASSFCVYFNADNNRNVGVYSMAPIPQNNTVLVEHPLVQSLNTPFLQCEVCLSRTKNPYTCLDCRYKTYCSLLCMSEDENTHIYECNGYKMLLLPVLDAGNLYRVFLRIAILLNDRIFLDKSFRKVTTAAEVMESIEAYVSENNQYGYQYLKLLKTKPDYYKLMDMQYSTLVVTAFRLLMFIETKTFAIEAFFQKLNLTNKHKMIVIGSILMRLQCHLLLNTFDFEFNFTQRDNKPDIITIQKEMKAVESIIKPNDGLVDDIVNFYEVDIQKDVLDISEKLMERELTTRISPGAWPNFNHTQPCNRIQRLLSTYKDNIAELYFNPDSAEFFLYGEAAGMPTTQTSATMMCSRIYEMSSEERISFVRIFVNYFHIHMGEYFVRMSYRHTGMDQIMSFFCTTLNKFRHSCDPNVDVIILENGVILGKSNRDIEMGEEITISYKANYMKHTRAERKAFLRTLGIECDCKYCQMPEEEESINKRQIICCSNCPSTQISPIQGKCHKCRTTYNNLMLKYRLQLKVIDEEVKKRLKHDADDRQLFILHMMNFLKSRDFFASCNELNVRVKLKYIKFLALKNFGELCLSLIRDIRRQLMRTYTENIIWFTFYADLLSSIKIILYYNLEQNYNSISTNGLRELCRLGLHIVQGQKIHVELYETFDNDGGQILQDLRNLVEWEANIPCNDLLDDIEDIKKTPILLASQHQIDSENQIPELIPGPFEN